MTLVRIKAKLLRVCLRRETNRDTMLFTVFLHHETSSATQRVHIPPKGRRACVRCLKSQGIHGVG